MSPRDHLLCNCSGYRRCTAVTETYLLKNWATAHASPPSGNTKSMRSAAVARAAHTLAVGRAVRRSISMRAADASNSSWVCKDGANSATTPGHADMCKWMVDS